MWDGCQHSPEEGIRCPWNKVQVGGCEPHDVGVGNLGPSQEQYILLTAEPSHPTPTHFQFLALAWSGTCYADQLGLRVEAVLRARPPERQAADRSRHTWLGSLKIPLLSCLCSRAFSRRHQEPVSFQRLPPLLESRGFTAVPRAFPQVRPFP